jgi:hypothetical protein
MTAADESEIQKLIDELTGAWKRGDDEYPFDRRGMIGFCALHA